MTVFVIVLRKQAMSDPILGKTTFQRLLSRSLLLPVLAMLLLASALIWQTTRLLEASRWVEHTDQVLTQSEHVLKLMLDQETGERGFLVSKNPLFLQPYRRAALALPSEFASLEALVRDNPAQTERLKEIQSAYNRWLQTAQREIGLRLLDKNYKAAFDSAQGKTRMDALRGRVSGFQRTEAALREEREGAVRRSTNRMLFCAGGLTLGIGAGLAFSNRRRLLLLSSQYETALDQTRQQAIRLQHQAKLLHDQQEHLSTTLMSIGDAVIVTDAGGRVTLLNPAAERMTGWAQVEAAGKPIQEIAVLRRKNAPPVESLVQKVLRGEEEAGDARLAFVVSRTEEEIPMEYTASPICNAEGLPDGAVLVFHDLSERTKAEARLQKREADFRQLFADNPHPMWVYGMETLKFLEVNEAAVAQYGYSREEFQRMRITDIRPPEDVPRLLEDVQSARSPIQSREDWRHRRKNGEVFPAAITSHTLEFAGQSSALVIAQDISLRRKAEEELRHANEFRDRVMDNAIFGVAAFDLEARFTLVNQQMAAMIGLSIEALLNTSFSAMIPPEEWPFVLEQFSQTAQEGTSISRAETRLIRRQGEELNVVFGLSPLRVEGKIIGVVGTLEDVTDRKRLENQLLQSQKLESIGRLAGGVAHDFNNLLTAILGYSELAEYECGLDETGKEYLVHIRQAAERAAGLTHQLLAFARRQVIEPKVFSLNDLVLNLDGILKRLIGEHIELTLLTDPNLGRVKVDPGQFEQILVNLVVNARDALPNGGKITLETRNTFLDSDYALQHDGVIPGEYVLLAVSDTGTGMDESVQLHIFEPFFTTKEKGRGTGLGLATVYGIVRQAGGHIWLYSEPGHGTTFRIYLPRTQEPGEEAAAPPQRETRSVLSENILLVEDDAMVRTLASQVLKSCGYRIVEASQGEEALQKVAEQEAGISLLITDVVMPQMSGKELAQRIQALNPAIKVLYASGYTEDTIVHHGVLEPGITFLSKPFSPNQLLRKVRELLDAPAASEIPQE